MTSGGADTLAAYTTSGASKGRVTVGSHPMGAVFDANNNSVYVAYAGTLGAAIDMQSAQMAGISQVSEGLAVKPNQGGFATTSPSTLYTGIEFDPYTKQLYVADAGQPHRRLQRGGRARGAAARRIRNDLVDHASAGRSDGNPFCPLTGSGESSLRSLCRGRASPRTHLPMQAQRRCC